MFSRDSRRRESWTRRQLLRFSAAGVLGASASGWLEALADESARVAGRKRSCILLWMNGGPSQIDTFDLKPGHPNGGPIKPIDTSVPGIQISQHLPKLAREMNDVAIIRSMTSKEGDHGRATYHLRTGYRPIGQIQYPTLGSLVSKELEDERLELPGFVSISPFRGFNAAAYGPGFLGHEYAPLIVGDANYGGGRNYAQALKVKDLDSAAGVNRPRADARLGLLDGFDNSFISDHPSAPPASHKSAYERAVRLMRSSAVKAFELDQEPARVRDAYGRNTFGQGCLLARRLIERGVPFVEVTLNGVENLNVFGWDTHLQNFDAVQKLCSVLDPAWSTLMADLRSRGLLDSTLIVWMGEFGRTPKINGSAGRDHYPNAWTTVLAGGGVKGGQAIGKTSPDGMKVADRPVNVPDFLATAVAALGIDPRTQNVSNVGRPIRIADPDAKIIREAIA